MARAVTLFTVQRDDLSIKDLTSPGELSNYFVLHHPNSLRVL